MSITSKATAILSIVLASNFCYAQDELKHQNLGSSVNSSVDELKPIISADGKTLYMIRNGHAQNLATEDIWYSTLSSDGSWDKALHPASPLNQGKNTSVCNVSPDGNTLVIKGAYVDGEYEGSGFSIVTKNKKGNWGEPKKLDIKNFAKYVDAADCMGAYYCGDGKTILIYLCDVNDGQRTNIYFSKLIEREKWSKGKSLKDFGKFLSKALNNKTWTEPELLGNINTKEYEETYCFLASDGVTLYFASNRPGGQGDLDLWMAKRQDDTWKKWSEPVNLGPKINSKGRDAYYCLDAKAEYAYLVSDHNSIGGDDIVKVKLAEDIKPNPVVLIRGKVFNAKTKEPIGAGIEYENLVDGKNAGFANSNPMTGEYTIILPYGKNYGFLGSAEKFIPVSDNMDLTQVAAYQEINRDLYLVPLEVGSVIRLNNIFFDFGKATLRPESVPEMERLAGYMASNKGMEIEISGHTDNVGSADANLKLSDDRAKAVADYLVSMGIEAPKIKFKGYGETKPVSTNDTDEGKQMNRRVEFTILKN
ncbi:MAG: outer membrane protein OmpA family [Bacteroidetes bacterium]|jgi:outer membrane protein OmpA-like peptidoglycan-associated protein|nr:outer membrane protein OmpA family [Bacteroidota bacterium]